MKGQTIGYELRIKQQVANKKPCGESNTHKQKFFWGELRASKQLDHWRSNLYFSYK